MSEQTQHKGLGRMIGDYCRDFKVLGETRSEYWGMQVINFIDSTVFFAVYTIAAVMLSDDFGFSDESAGYVVTVYSSTTTICLFLSGTFTDWLGIKKSLYVAMAGQAITRGGILLVAFMPDLPGRNVIIFGAFFLMAPFVAMVQTVFQAANKRFTTKRSRGAGFNLWYLFMNIGAAGGGILIDMVRRVFHWHNAHIFTIGMFAGLTCMVVTFLMIRREDQLLGPGEAPEEEPVLARRKKPWEIAWAVLSESTFWRFLVLASLLIGVRSVFIYLHLLWPKYWLRVIGPDALIGTLQTINPVLVIVGLIVLIPVLHRFNVYKMLVYGAMISAMSLFVLAVPSYGNTTYIVSIFALVVLTIGEVIWSPRLQEYTAAIAPKGQEGTYLGLSMVPYFVAKTFVAGFSGHMLTRYVPKDVLPRLEAGEVTFWDSPSALWIYLGCFAMAGPVVGLILKGWFTKGAKWTKEEQEPDQRDADNMPPPEPSDGA